MTIGIALAVADDFIRLGLPRIFETVRDGQPSYTITGAVADPRQFRGLSQKTEVVILVHEPEALDLCPCFCDLRAIFGESVSIVLMTAYLRESEYRKLSQVGLQVLLKNPSPKDTLLAALDLLPRHTVIDKSIIVSESLTGQRLTAREDQVLLMLANGLTVKEIAIAAGLSSKTVEAHKFNLMRKLDLHTKAQLILYVDGRLSNGNDSNPE